MTGEQVIRVSVGAPVNQDVTVLKMVHYWTNGQRFYAKRIEWEECQPYDELDLSEVTFPGTVYLDVERRQP